MKIGLTKIDVLKMWPYKNRYNSEVDLIKIDVFLPTYDIHVLQTLIFVSADENCLYKNRHFENVTLWK